MTKNEFFTNYLIMLEHVCGLIAVSFAMTGVYHYIVAVFGSLCIIFAVLATLTLNYKLVKRK